MAVRQNLQWQYSLTSGMLPQVFKDRISSSTLMNLILYVDVHLHYPLLPLNPSTVPRKRGDDLMLLLT